MSVHVSSWLWRNSTAKGSELLLLLAIADWADDNGKAWPSVDTLSQKTRLSKRQTQSIVRQLEADKLLITHPNQGPNGVNIYQIIMGGEKIAPVQSGVEGGAVQRTEGVKPTAPNTSIDTSENTLSFSPSDEDTNDGVETPAVEEKPIDLQIMDAFCEETGLAKFASFATARKQAQQLAKADFTPDEVRELIKWLRAQAWITSGISLGLCLNQADQFRTARTNRKSVAQGGGQVVRKADTEASQKAWDDIMRPLHEN